MERLTVNKPVSEMTMVELAHNNCFVKDGEAFYRDYEGEIRARDMARELAKMSGYELPENNEEFDYEIMDDLYITENITKRSLIALFYRSLWVQAELYECLKSYEDTGLTPDKIREIDRLYTEKCRELAGERKRSNPIKVKTRGSMYVECKCGEVIRPNKYCAYCGQRLDTDFCGETERSDT